MGIVRFSEFLSKIQFFCAGRVRVFHGQCYLVRLKQRIRVLALRNNVPALGNANNCIKSLVCAKEKSQIFSKIGFL